jgi:ribosomal-protein-alanine N-acetyltransferase
VCGPARLGKNQAAVGKALGHFFTTNPWTTATTIWDQTTKPIRDDWSNGHKVRGTFRTIPTILGFVFLGKGLSKLGELAKAGKLDHHGGGRQGGNSDGSPGGNDGAGKPKGDHGAVPQGKYTIRSPTRSDVAAIADAYKRDAERIGQWNRLRSPQQVEQWVRSQGPTYRIYLIEDRSNGGLAGFGSISNITRTTSSSSAVLGFNAFTPYVGRGWMTEGLQRVITKTFTPERDGGLGLDQLELEVEVGNERSRALAVRLGGRYQGTVNAFRLGAMREYERFIIKAKTLNHPP